MLNHIKRHTTRCILGLVLCALAGAVALGHTSPMSAAPAAPTIAVTAHDNWAGINDVPSSLRYEFTNHPHYTVHITGAGFTPGNTVRLALLNAARWELLSTGATQAQPATTGVICGHDFAICQRSNPRAGTIDYRMRFSDLPAASNLVVLYRSAGGAGIREVTLQ